MLNDPRSARRRYNGDGTEWSLKQLSLESQAETFAQRWCEHISGGAKPKDLQIGYDYENWVVYAGTSFGPPLFPIVHLILDHNVFREQNALGLMQEPEEPDDDSGIDWEQWHVDVEKVALTQLKEKN